MGLELDDVLQGGVRGGQALLIKGLFGTQPLHLARALSQTSQFHHDGFEGRLHFLTPIELLFLLRREHLQIDATRRPHLPGETQAIDVGVQQIHVAANPLAFGIALGLAQLLAQGIQTLLGIIDGIEEIFEITPGLGFDRRAIVRLLGEDRDRRHGERKQGKQYNE